jgi:hypothetical protein
MYSSASATFSGCCPRPVAGALLEEYKRRRVPLALYALFVGYACEAAALIVATNTLYESRKLHYAVSKQLGGGAVRCSLIFLQTMASRHAVVYIQISGGCSAWRSWGCSSL